MAETSAAKVRSHVRGCWDWSCLEEFTGWAWPKLICNRQLGRNQDCSLVDDSTTAILGVVPVMPSRRSKGIERMTEIDK